MTKDELFEILRHPKITSFDFIELVDNNSGSKQFLSWVDELLLELNDNNEPIAFKFCELFGRLSGDSQRALAAGRLSTIEVLSATSQRGHSVAGYLVHYSPIAIYHFEALKHPSVYKSGHDSTIPVLSVLARSLGYSAVKSFLLNDDFDTYLAWGNKHTQIPAFEVASDPEFLSTGLQFRPDVYNYTSKNNLRVANLMHGYSIFDDIPVEKLIGFIVELAMKKHPYPCRGKLDNYIEGSNYILRQSLMLISEEFECLEKGEGLEHQHDIAKLHACLAVACHKELNEATELLIEKTVGEIIDRSNASELSLLLDEVNRFPSFKGSALLQPMLTMALNNLTIAEAAVITETEYDQRENLTLY